MGNTNTGKVNGEWLKIALKALGESQTSAAIKLNKRRDYFQKHISGKSYLKAESLAELACTFPSINLHYILTGEGCPLL